MNTKTMKETEKKNIPKSCNTLKAKNALMKLRRLLKATNGQQKYVSFCGLDHNLLSVVKVKYFTKG